jgi:VWFA-related protein
LCLAVLGSAVLLGAQPPQDAPPSEPRFRGGTNLVRLDVYVSQKDVAVTDLSRDDFEVLEDNAPQEVSSFELVRARAAVPDSARVEPNTVAESRARAAEPDARLFVLFLDTLNVQIDGSYRAQAPVAALLDRIVGADDLVGVMTPEMSARNITFSPRTAPVAQMLSANWAWGKRGGAVSADPREDELKLCYPDNGDTAGVAKALIERRREQQTLDSIRELLTELEREREERTFVLLLTEGWTLPRPDERLARVLQTPGGQMMPGGPEPIGTGPDGRLATRPQAGSAGGSQSCERERSLLALADLSMEFDRLIQRANRANVSFYPIDPRGLVAFDDPIGPDRPSTPAVDAQRLNRRQEGLRSLAADTDGMVVLNSNIDRALPRLLTDIGSYYLLGYVSTNPKLDGRYRRLTVRVKRPGLTVRARPGYLAPTPAEFGRLTSAARAAPPPAASGASASPRQGGSPSGTAPPAPSVVRDALSRLPTGRLAPPLYLQAAGGAGHLQIVVELDRGTAASPDWANGATVRVDVGPADAANAPRETEEFTLEPGARVYALRHPDRDLLTPGRYQVRAQVLPQGGRRSPLTLATVVVVPNADALLGEGATASRRGPGTGRLFLPTADPRFRRTERLVVETPLVTTGATVAARLLNRAGQPMAVPVTLSEKLDESLQLRVALAEVTLAPLAPGEYVVEMTATGASGTSTVSYAFRIVP